MAMMYYREGWIQGKGLKTHVWRYTLDFGGIVPLTCSPSLPPSPPLSTLLLLLLTLLNRYFDSAQMEMIEYRNSYVLC